MMNDESEKFSILTKEERLRMDDIHKEKEKLHVARADIFEKSDNLEGEVAELRTDTYWQRDQKTVRRVNSKVTKIRAYKRKAYILEIQLKRLSGESKKIKGRIAERKLAFKIAKDNPFRKEELNWESFFVQAAKAYLSGNEFEIICKTATSMMEIRKG